MFVYHDSNSYLIKKQTIINRFAQQLSIAGYSKQTIKSYTSALQKLLEYVAVLNAAQITEKEIADYFILLCRTTKIFFF